MAGNPHRRRFPHWGWLALGVAVLYFVVAYLILPQLGKEKAHHHPDLRDGARLTHTGSGLPGDPLNIALVGSEEDVVRALLAAGWKPADSLSFSSSVRIVIDTIIDKPDPNAPVSNLYLFGRKEDLAFEKPVGHSPKERHHVRFWRSEEMDDGRPMWMGAATHDVGVELSRTTAEVTHRISPDVDAERELLLADLTEVHRLLGIRWIDGFHQELQGRNGGGDPWHRRTPAGRNAHHFHRATRPTHTMKTTVLLALLLPLSLLAQDSPEQPPTLSASAILKPEFASGDGFTVRDPVPTYGGRNVYTIDSEAGVFEADGNVMLMRRVREIAAIARLREVSRSDEFKTALGTAVASPLLVTKGLIEHPVSTVTGVPKGLWKFMNRAGQGMKERVDGRERSQYEDSNAAQLIGFSKAKRDVALKLGVDPYSSNEVLQKELNGISWAAYAGKMSFTIATAPVSGAAGLALTAVGVTDTFEKSLRDQSPSDLRLASLKQLLAMGCDRAVADTFLNNTAFSPSVQTALVLHLDALTGVANRSSFIQLAGEYTENEGDAIFLCETSRILAQLHAGGRTLTRLDTLFALPIAFTAEGGAVVALEWDYAAWTQNAAEFVARLKAVKIGNTAPTSFLIALSGDASPLVQQQAEKAGVVLAMRLAPGPLR